MMPRRIIIAVAASAALAATGVGTALATGAFGPSEKERVVARALSDTHPKNVIFLLGDGMGTQEITAARYYQGVGNPLNVDRLPLTGFDTTWSVKPAAAPPYLPDYAPDSASTGTMWATGQKTIDERISQGPSSAINVPGANLPTVLERWQRRGARVGNVSTAEITDATPAVLASHISLRGCQGPADMGNCASERKGAGGLGSIAEQEVDHKVDVLLGGGRNRFTATIPDGPDAGKTVVDSAQRQGYQYVTDAAGLEAVTNKGPKSFFDRDRDRGPKPVLGLFTGGNMSVEWSGPAASTGKGNDPVPCLENQRPANEPSLADMTSKAIKLLESNNNRGFFLQVEGASIDKRDHAADVCGQIGENLEFDEAVGVALDYQRQHEDTLVVITADHSHTSQIVPANQDTPGFYATLETADGFPIRVSYATGKTAGGQTHTGARVPVAAIGPQATNVMGVRDQTDLFKTLIGRD